jgi:hypothetical protein
VVEGNNLFISVGIQNESRTPHPLYQNFILVTDFKSESFLIIDRFNENALTKERVGKSLANAIIQSILRDLI